MKVLLVNNRYPSASKPQVATYILTIKEALQKAGFEVDLLVNDNNWNSPIGKWLDLLLFWKKVKSFKKFDNYDWVYFNHFNLYYSFCKSSVSPEKSIFHWHGNEVFARSPIWKKLNIKSLPQLPKEALHITPSAYFKKEVNSRFGIENIMVSPSGGIDTDYFIEAKKTAKDEVVVGYASHVNKEKGFDLFYKLIEAYKDSDKIKFRYIAYGEELHEYKAKLKSMNNVLALDPLPKKEMRSFYHNLDVLIMPTKRKAESLGLVGLEAMSCGVPVIGSNDFALPEYIKEGVSGELFKTDDADSLIQAFNRYLNSKDDYTPRTVVLEEYSITSVVAFYKTMLTGNH